MDSKKENLRELIEKFMDSDNTQQYLEDIETGERILLEYPAPEPDDMLLVNIKANIALRKMRRKTVIFRKRFVELFAVAASIAIIAAISLQFFAPPAVGSQLPEGWWDKTEEAHVKVLNDFRDIYTQLEQMETPDDNFDTFVIDEFKNQITELENRFIDIETSENNYSNIGIIEEFENQYNDIKNSSFWPDDYSYAGTLEL